MCVLHGRAAYYFSSFLVWFCFHSQSFPCFFFFFFSLQTSAFLLVTIFPIIWSSNFTHFYCSLTTLLQIEGFSVFMGHREWEVPLAITLTHSLYFIIYHAFIMLLSIHIKCSADTDHPYQEAKNPKLFGSSLNRTLC